MFALRQLHELTKDVTDSVKRALFVNERILWLRIELPVALGAHRQDQP